MIEDDIRSVLSKQAMRVEQLAERVNSSYDTVCRVTGFKMFDVYEEDNGVLKLLGTNPPTLKIFGRGGSYNVPDEIIAVVKKLSGTMSYRQIVNAIEARFGRRLTASTIFHIAKQYNLPKYDTRKWTDEADRFVLSFCGDDLELIVELKQRFGLDVSVGALRVRKSQLRRRK